MKLSLSKRTFAAGSLAATALALAFVPFNMGGCSGADLNVTNLVNGVQQVGHSMALGEKDEPALGEAVALQATNRYAIYQDQSLNRYVTLVGRTVATAAPRTTPYFFAVLDTDEVNAFSAPGGYVFITRGAIQRMKDESELAGVLGHEIGHVCKHHGLDAAKSATFKQGVVTAASSEGHAAQFNTLSDGLGTVILNTGFSQPQEEEADVEGVKYVVGAGYDPNGFVHFLQRMQQGQSHGLKLFSTHPGLGDRIKKVNDQIAKTGKGGQGATLADRFAQSVSLPKVAVR
ncbi:MAG: putative Peptidase Ste24p [Phycisphaerales bacterium]|nr:putative Peptidase Ste24p [Phycisphaerales bacterium]